MFAMKVVKAWNKAIALEENWKPTGPRWTFVDADMYAMCSPQTQNEVDQFYHLFNDLADQFSKYNAGLSFADYTAKVAMIEQEYKELFGMGQ